MSGEQTDAENRKTGNRDDVKANKVGVLFLVTF